MEEAALEHRKPKRTGEAGVSGYVAQRYAGKSGCCYRQVMRKQSSPFF